ncbi:hypothetical protein NB640_04235 [Oxalobacter vibrioformis]|uniref:Uncharacterized protein n=1 Tax=Oxalobacter vibrioformis TaxID=933080 RepID=A0A9E9P589_9BURK|nr:hypothetical protein [Oxalobacter vibrioformis]WAW10861.1 hypothetical protein NB640_04235 [Oxalobacter vibrioformis]
MNTTTISTRIFAFPRLQEILPAAENYIYQYADCTEKRKAAYFEGVRAALKPGEMQNPHRGNEGDGEKAAMFYLGFTLTRAYRDGYESPTPRPPGIYSWSVREMETYSLGRADAKKAAEAQAEAA